MARRKAIGALIKCDRDGDLFAGGKINRIGV